MFALDLARSRPEIKAANYNFASLKVGNEAFVNFQERQASIAKTVRVQNVYNKTPCMPRMIPGYRRL